MECAALFVVFIVLTIVVPMYRMLTGKGANNWRRLLRIDLAALLVITAGCAGALAIVRWLDLPSALCLLTFVLPLCLGFAWLARYVIEDVANKRRKLREPGTDFSFLSRNAPPKDEIVEAEAIVEHAPDDG